MHSIKLAPAFVQSLTIHIGHGDVMYEWNVKVKRPFSRSNTAFLAI